MSIEKGKSVHCAETITGRGLTGTLLISEEDLRLKLFSYSGPFQINQDAPLHLIAETGDSVSLHACIRGGSGTRSGYEHTVNTEEVIANVAVVGPDPWTDSDRIKRVCFSVKHTMELMRSRERIDGIGREKYPGEKYLKLFRDKAKGMTLGAHYSGIWGMDFHTPKHLWPVFEIEFDEPQDIHGFIKHVTNYVNFLSFCLGVPLRPSEITVNRLSLAEIT